METKNLINLQELDGKALEVCIKQINKHFNINFLKAENGEAVAACAALEGVLSEVIDAISNN